MHGEALFVAGYALSLVGLAAGLHRRGRGTDVDASRLHDVIAGVAGAAAATMALGEALRHHAAPELAVLLLVAALGLVTGYRRLAPGPVGGGS